MSYVQELKVPSLINGFDASSLHLSGYGRNTINGVAYTSVDGKSTTGFNYSFGMIKKNDAGVSCFDMNFLRKHSILPPYAHKMQTEMYHVVAETFKNLEDIGIELFRARLSLIRGGESIPTHADSPETSDYCIKIHIPVITNDSARFIFNDNAYKMDVGKVYIADVSEPHSFVNHEMSDRYHIIADCIVTNKELPFYCHDYKAIMQFYDRWQQMLDKTCTDRWLSQSQFYQK